MRARRTLSRYNLPTTALETERRGAETPPYKARPAEPKELGRIWADAVGGRLGYRWRVAARERAAARFFALPDFFAARPTRFFVGAGRFFFFGGGRGFCFFGRVWTFGFLFRRSQRHQIFIS